jgi:hypothetical protein
MGVDLIDPAPVEDPVLKQRVVAAIAPAADQAVGDSLRVDLSRAAPFVWDTLYIFSRAGTAEAILQATGLRWRGESVHSDDNLLIFVWRGQLAGFVEFRGFNLKPGSPFVNFDGHFGMGELFTPATAIFRAVHKTAKQENGKPTHYIELHPPPRTTSVYRPEYARYLAQKEQAYKDSTPLPAGPRE